jgi:Ca2+-binding EF-hand superfamily protein
LKKAFDAFDHEKKGCIGTDMVGTILSMLGYDLTESILQEIISEVDEDGEYYTIIKKTLGNNFAEKIVFVLLVRNTTKFRFVIE